jgi:DMSO/TMAO reductase YedYZ heme-binding membrane subunit
MVAATRQQDDSLQQATLLCSEATALGQAGAHWACLLKLAYYFFIAALLCAAVEIVAGPWPRWLLLVIWLAIAAALLGLRFALRQRARSLLRGTVSAPGRRVSVVPRR